jgi:type II secretory pathway pseudopilin PulG
MIMNLKKSSLLQLPFSNRGFALIATIMLMVLLAIITIGTLSLSAVTLRSGYHEQAQMQAQANARMALMIAIGELQKQVGPDQRITANSSILSTGTVPNPNWTGVWDSWIAGDLTKAPVGANYPDAASEHQTIGSVPDPKMRPNYPQKSRHFRGWLLSLNPGDNGSIYSPLGPVLQGKDLPQASDTAVQLVGKGSLGSSGPTTDYVSARLIDVEPESRQSKYRGRFAWWAGDESQKATIMEDSYLKETSTTMAKRLFRQEAPASMGNTSITGLTKMKDDSQLAKLATKGTIGLVEGVTKQDASLRFHDITTSSMGVLADVREGGLKRDLNTILERNIDPAEVFNLSYVQEFQRADSYKPEANSFLLYNFDNLHSSPKPTGQAIVPIQDLAAYYQLYDGSRPGWGGGIQFSSSASSPANNLLPNGVMISNTDFGGYTSDFNKFLRGYTAQYRCPIPVKLEVMLSYVTEPRTAAEIEADPLTLDGDPNTTADDYKLMIGLSPAMTFWNPNNVPLVMNLSNPEYSSIFMRHYPIPVSIKIMKKTSSSTTAPETGSKTIEMRRVSQTQDELFNFFYSGRNKAVFEPGETKVISLQYTSQTDSDLATANTDIDFHLRGGGSRYGEQFIPSLELVEGWQPERFVRPLVRDTTARAGQVFTFKAGDYVSAEINGGTDGGLAMEISQKSRHGRNSPGVMWHYRTQRWASRFWGSASYLSDFCYLGFPKSGRGGAIASVTPRPIQIAPRSGNTLISAMGNATNLKDDLPQSFFYYSIKFGTESHESRNFAQGGAGRRFPSRPFLHSSPTINPFYDKLDATSTYNYGWNWAFMGLNNFQQAPISISADNHGYFGGGYTAENGTTHNVQRQLPLTPPMSIAALSHAILGGHSIATEPPFEGYDAMVSSPLVTESLRRVCATGHNGLGPATQQAIGNSYAHPSIPAGKAYTTVNRMFVEGVDTQRPFVDHSYLANKALWDDFFFSSITPEPKEVKIYETNTSRTAKKVAEDFFFENKPLPNRRIKPYLGDLDQTKLDSLFTDPNLYIDGLADQIAAHLMVNGSFNINSTSVEAWKAVFSSLKGKPVAYLDKDTALTDGVSLKEDRPSGVPIGPGGAANGKSYKNSSSDPSDPEQWIGWRDLTDEEIKQLAIAMVKQVKLRGPFLSLSEFVNRRLDSTNPTLSLKGALQAAIDDPNVPINAGFRSNDRIFTAAEKTYMNAVFPEAMEGAIAYGSSAYVDQADILRNTAEQLSPRGDTFVIRTYGDSIDANGKVIARAWCEAVVQRVPEYVDLKDKPHLKQSELTSDHNKKFGRKIQLVSFRWLNNSEI